MNKSDRKRENWRFATLGKHDQILGNQLAAVTSVMFKTLYKKTQVRPTILGQSQYIKLYHGQKKKILNFILSQVIRQKQYSF